MGAWREEDLLTVTAIAAVTIGFIAYQFIAHAPSLYKRFHQNYRNEQAAVNWVLFQKFTGFAFLGLLPAIAGIWAQGSLAFFGMKLSLSFIDLYWILGAAVLIIPINLVNARKPDNLEVYPQIRAKEWTYGLFALNALGWASYLLAYEFLFRGLLLFGTLEALGMWPAIALNVCIYACVHMPKGVKETIGAIPLGIVVCIATIQTGTIWAAFFIHLLLALSNDVIAFSAHPDMKLVKEKS